MENHYIDCVTAKERLKRLTIRRSKKRWTAYLLACALMLTSQIAWGAELLTRDLDLTDREVCRIYAQGAPGITVFALPQEHPASQQFFREFCGKSAAMFFAYWKRREFSGLQAHIVLLENVQQVMKAVEKTPGSVGYLE